MEFRDYFLIFVCFAAAAIIFFKFAKEKKVFISAGFLCLLYGGYNTAKALLDEGSPFLTAYSWILRGAAVCVLIWMFLVLRDEKALSQAEKTEEKPVQDEFDDDFTVVEKKPDDAVTDEDSAE